MASCRIREVRLAKIVNTVFRSFTFQPAFHRGYRIRLSDSAQMQCSLIPMALRPDPNTQVPAALETQHKQRSWQTRQRELKKRPEERKDAQNEGEWCPHRHQSEWYPVRWLQKERRKVTIATY
ncbi:unnamed protein product [Durusdinium trenchii]|uniref:Uncharacterized protein n=1 Tax=Durusdinium trenchii TaxID=1381693 RepID=A0ABP0RI05_9DINO